MTDSGEAAPESGLEATTPEGGTWDGFPVFISALIGSDEVGGRRAVFDSWGNPSSEGCFRLHDLGFSVCADSETIKEETIQEQIQK